jgi:hypothetical protein
MPFAPWRPTVAVTSLAVETAATPEYVQETVQAEMRGRLTSTRLELGYPDQLLVNGERYRVELPDDPGLRELARGLVGQKVVATGRLEQRQGGRQVFVVTGLKPAEGDLTGLPELHRDAHPLR